MSVTELPIERINPIALEGKRVEGRIGTRRYVGYIVCVHGQKDYRRYHVDCDDRTVVVRPDRAKHTIDFAEEQP
jgi:hypothetical protein